MAHNLPEVAEVDTDRMLHKCKYIDSAVLIVLRQ